MFKQESWEAALAHVQDVDTGRQPSIRSDGPFYRLLAYCPRPAWRWEHLESLQSVRVFDGRSRRCWSRHDVDALAARTKARELAWARNEGGDAVAVDADGVRYILLADGAALFVVRPHLGGISRCEESWVWAVLAGPVGHVANGTFQEWYKRRDLSEDHDAHYKDILRAAQVVEKLVLESDKETGLAGEWREAALTVCPMCGGDLDEEDFISIIGRGIDDPNCG